MSLLGRSPYGHPLSTNSGGTVSRVAASAPTLASLAALLSTDPACTHGNEVLVDADNSLWVYDSLSTLTADHLLVEIPGDSVSPTGRWVRKAGYCDLRMPIAFGTADAAVLATIPAGMRFNLLSAYWEVTTSWTGGSSSAIGISSGTVSGATTKGDILGGASGDVLATLVSTGASGFVAGTAGATMDTIAHMRTKIFVATDTFRFDRITSAFTAGAGFAHVRGILDISPTT